MGSRSSPVSGEPHRGKGFGPKEVLYQKRYCCTPIEAHVESQLQTCTSDPGFFSENRPRRLYLQIVYKPQEIIHFEGCHALKRAQCNEHPQLVVEAVSRIKRFYLSCPLAALIQKQTHLGVAHRNHCMYCHPPWMSAYETIGVSPKP